MGRLNPKQRFYTSLPKTENSRCCLLFVVAVASFCHDLRTNGHAQFSQCKLMFTNTEHSLQGTRPLRVSSE